MHEWLIAENERECQELLEETAIHADYSAQQLAKSEAMFKPTIVQDLPEPIEVTVLPIPSLSSKYNFIVYSNV